MYVNLVVIIMTILIGFHYSRYPNADSDINRKRYIRIICFILILQSGLRNVAVGDDTYGYYFTFTEVLDFTWEKTFNGFTEYLSGGEGKDTGYDVFQKIFQIFSHDYQLYLLTVATLFFTSLGNFLYKNTSRLKDLIFAFVIYSVLFYSFYSITGIRQTIATAFTLYGYEYIKKRNFLKFLLIVLIASVIHKSALIFIPFYFLSKLRKPKYFFSIILFLFPILMIFKGNLALLLSSIGGYEEYTDYEGAGTFTFTALFVLISIVALVRYKSIKLEHNYIHHFYAAFAVALLFLPLSWINPSALRIIMYFSIFMLLFIPEIIYSFASMDRNLYAKLINLAIITLFILFIKTNLNMESKYAFFWEKMELGKNYD